MSDELVRASLQAAISKLQSHYALYVKGELSDIGLADAIGPVQDRLQLVADSAELVAYMDDQGGVMSGEAVTEEAQKRKYARRKATKFEKGEE